uniref:Ig-like domain-containing protein n=1 Tax=Ascaris lumbricoides TaxID=6252 RepID=A0A0M3HRJ8_ASCLU
MLGPFASGHKRHSYQWRTNGMLVSVEQHRAKATCRSHEDSSNGITEFSTAYLGEEAQQKLLSIRAGNMYLKFGTGILTS